jgi:hypothetical protein
MPQQTKIKSIRVKNIKGFSEKTFEFRTPEMFGNKFHVLVAPNGFGKSSLATAFLGLRPRSLKIEKDHKHKEDNQLQCELEVVIDEDGETRALLADSGRNDLSTVFSVSVINCRLRPKATQLTHIPGARPKASLVLDPVVLVERIPERPPELTTQALKERFGINGKVIPDMERFLTSASLVSSICRLSELRKFTQQRVWNQLDPIIDAINGSSGTAEAIKAWIEMEHRASLRGIQVISQIADLLKEYDDVTETESLLAAIVFGQIHRDDPSLIKKIGDRCFYTDSKEKCRGLLASLNSNPAWIDVRPREDHGKLVVNFPAATSMSNGQRDLFSFIAQLIRAQFELKTEKAILVVDEVFDYLDEANLLAAQYYVTEFIEAFKRRGGTIFPLFLTHLDPQIFRHSVFGLGKGELRKVHMLDQALDVSRTGGTALMVRKRDDPALEAVIGKFIFHYHPDGCDESALFEQHGLRKRWGNSEVFYSYVGEQLEAYLADAEEVDFMAVCVAVRISIEKAACVQLTEAGQIAFTDDYDDGTSGKLEFAEKRGARVPSSHKILGLLYNDMLHHKEQFDYISSIVSKMRNPAIRGMIREAFSR